MKKSFNKAIMIFIYLYIKIKTQNVDFIIKFKINLLIGAIRIFFPTLLYVSFPPIICFFPTHYMFLSHPLYVSFPPFKTL